MIMCVDLCVGSADAVRVPAYTIALAQETCARALLCAAQGASGRSSAKCLRTFSGSPRRAGQFRAEKGSGGRFRVDFRAPDSEPVGAPASEPAAEPAAAMN